MTQNPGFSNLDELLARVLRMQSGVIAIDGPCASGKSTLGALLQNAFSLSVLHLDDFFLRPEQRTPERLAEPGGNIDRERFLREAYGPYRDGVPFAYRPFDCATQTLLAPVSVVPTPVRVVEGVYAMHPAFRGLYALSVFVKAGLSARRERLLARNGEAMLRRFDTVWIPMEDAYFEGCAVELACDMTLVSHFEQM